MTTPKYKHKLWSKKGARIREAGTRRVVPLKILLEEERKFGKLLVRYPFAHEEQNVRKAHCKLCGATLLPDEGIPFEILASNGYNRSKYYACEVCYSELKEHLI